MIGILCTSMCGTRDAGANWEVEFASCFTEAVWVQGKACPNINVNEDMDVTSVCHRDGVHALGDEDSLDKLNAVMETRCGVEVRATLGFEPRDDRCATFLNRQVRLNEDTLGLAGRLQARDRDHPRDGSGEWEIGVCACCEGARVHGNARSTTS